jgi:hypothetical protein
MVKRVGNKMGLNFTPAEDRIREIEEDVDLGKTEIIQSPRKILDLFLHMPEERIGSVELLTKLVLEQNVNVRIIAPAGVQRNICLTDDLIQ